MKIPTFKQGDPSQFTLQICGTIFSDLFLENNPRSPFLEPKKSLKNGIISIGSDNITYSIKGWTKDVYKSLLVSVSKNFRILPNKFSLRVTLLEILLL